MPVPPTDDDLIAQAYAAAAGQTPWEAMLHGLAGRFKLLLAQIIGFDTRLNRLLYSFEGGSGTAEGTLDYARKYHTIDPHVRLAGSLAVGQFVSFSEVIDANEVARHPFYQDYLIPYGGRHVHGARLHVGDTQTVMLGLHRGFGSESMSRDDCARAERVVYHLCKAVEIYLGLHTTFAEAALGQALLDRLATPVLLIDAQRRVVLQSPAGDALLRARQPCWVDDDGRLRTARAATDVELGLAVKALQLSGHPGLERQPAADRQVLSVPVPGALRPWVLTLLALRPESTMSAFGSRPLVLVLLHDPNAHTRLDPFVLTAAFDLTPAEARVAAGLASGETPQAIADAGGSSIHTVNTHVRAIQRKLGVSRTTEAVALLLSLPFAQLAPPASRQ